VTRASPKYHSVVTIHPALPFLPLAPAARAALVVCAVLALVGAPSLAAQASDTGARGPTEPTDGVPRGAPSLLVPADHWSIEALARLDAFVQTGAAVPWGVRTPTRRQVLEGLDAAVAASESAAREGQVDGEADGHADHEAPVPTGALARYYRDRFVEEMGRLVPDQETPRVRWLAGHSDVRVGRRYGAIATSRGMAEFLPSEPLGDARHLHAAVGGALEVGPVALSGEARIGEDGGPEARELYLAGRLRGVDLWAGRRAPAFGGARSGSTVLGGQVALDGGGLALAGPRILPSILQHMGPLRFETHLARFEENGFARRPWFWTARASVAPHPRLSVGVNRAAIFGGEGSPPTNFRNVILTLLGTRSEDPSGDFGRSFFANQVASVELRYRVPLRAAPTTLYLEWGMEDSSGAWLDVPGIIAGVQVAEVPGLPGVSVGLERTHFSPSCCDNPPWYRHAQFFDGWADGGLPLGHPLGGQGNEWLLYGRVDLLEAGIHSSWRAFRRERWGENLYVPTRPGRSLGGAFEVLYRVGSRTDLAVDTSYERGRAAGGWGELRSFLGIRTYF